MGKMESPVPRPLEWARLARSVTAALPQARQPKELLALLGDRVCALECRRAATPGCGLPGGSRCERTSGPSWPSECSLPGSPAALARRKARTRAAARAREHRARAAARRAVVPAARRLAAPAGRVAAAQGHRQAQARVAQVASPAPRAVAPARPEGQAGTREEKQGARPAEARAAPWVASQAAIPRGAPPAPPVEVWLATPEGKPARARVDKPPPPAARPGAARPSWS